MTEQRDRRTYLGSSDCAALLGLSDRDDALSVWRRKTGRLPELADSPQLVRGRRLEDHVLDWYSETYSVPIAKCGTVQHPSLPFVASTPDAALIVNGRCSLVIEAKTVGSAVAGEFGAEASDVVPPYYFAQGQSHMAATGAPICDLPALFGGFRFEFRTYRITRDDAFIAAWEKIAAEFWTRYVLTDTAPAGWLPESRGAWAKERWPGSAEPMIESDDPAVLAVVERFRVADLALDAAEAEHSDAKLSLIELIGPSEGIRTPDFLVTYRANKRGVKSLLPSWRREK